MHYGGRFININIAIKIGYNSVKDFFHGFGTRLFCVLILRFIEISTN